MSEENGKGSEVKPGTTVQEGDERDPSDIPDWPFAYAQIVLLHMTGQFTVEALTKSFGITPRRIAKILEDPKADQIRKGAKERIHAKLNQEVADQFPELLRLATRSLRRTLIADISPTHGMKANQDRVALEILKGYGILKPPDDGREYGITLDSAQYSGLVHAIEASARVQEIQALPETTYEEVDSE